MAFSASGWYIEGVGFGAGFMPRSDFVRSMAICAYCDAIIALFFQCLAVTTRPIPRQLVRAHAEWIHSLDVGMATTAEIGNVLAFGLAGKRAAMVECKTPIGFTGYQLSALRRGNIVFCRSAMTFLTGEGGVD